jgi:hypothetical protein
MYVYIQNCAYCLFDNVQLNTNFFGKAQFQTPAIMSVIISIEINFLRRTDTIMTEGIL